MSDFSSMVFTEWAPNGRTLVEASAGTGKTYNIQSAYLRLVLETGLPVQQILVVTFTEAATRELRNRLRQVLVDCRTALENRGGTVDPRVQTALDQARVRTDADPAEWMRRIQVALMEFDGAAIFTIHGFCNRVLERYAFECGHNPDAELLPGHRRVIRETGQDWWRGHAYDANQPNNPFGDVEKLVQLVEVLTQHPDARVVPESSLAPPPAPPPPPALRDDLKPNAQAAEWLNLLESTRRALERKPSDWSTLARNLPSIQSAFADARWHQAEVLPPAVEHLLQACRQVKALAKGKSINGWTFPASQLAEQASLDIAGLWELLQDHDGGLRGWLESGCVLKDTRKPAALKRLITEGRGLAANDFMAAVREVADVAGAAQLLEPTLPATRLFAERSEWIARSATALLGQQGEIARRLADQYRRRIRDRAALTYDAMLFNVREVLRDEQAGPRLKKVLRREFRAALIDEFQDTDPVQFGIFSSIFADSEMVPPAPPLLFVGDPKQAIYGFRNGDVFTYFEAKDGIPENRRHSLAKNYRSEKSLVAAINEVFRDDETPAFLANGQIPYAGDLLAQGTPSDRTLLVDGHPDPHPLKVWSYATAKGESIAGGSPLARRILADVAREIVRMLKDDRLGYPGDPPRRIRPSDVAVLVMRHAEAEWVQKELIRLGVNAVRQSTGRVFDTPEASQLALVMQAMLQPGRTAFLRSALSADFIPCPIGWIAGLTSSAPDAPDDQDAMGEPPPDAPDSRRSMEDWIEVFRESGRLWQTHSFMVAFQHLSRTLGLRAHVAGLPDGVQCLSTLLHLVELTHQEARAQQRGPVALMRWFTRQLESDHRDEDDDAGRIRMADDNDAVRIMTVFKSKGLQFPIVFLPTLWLRKAEARRSRDIALKYHDDGQRLVLDLDVQSEDGKARAMGERLEENIRMAYVGLTRAINRAVLVEVRDSSITPATHALEHLLERWRMRNPEAAATDATAAANPSTAGHVEFFAPPPDLFDVTRYHPEAPPSLAPPLPTPKVDKDHDRTSFTALSAHAADRPWPVPVAMSLPDGADVDQETEFPPPSEEIPPAEDPLLLIPGGAKLGTCWHRFFEVLDFQAPPPVIAEIVDDVLDQHGVCIRPDSAMPSEKQALLTRQRQSVHDMVRRVLSTELDTEHGRFRLSDIPLSSRRSELEFHFSLQPDSPRAIRDLAGILETHWQSLGRDEHFIEDMKTRTNLIPAGFMTGSIDLVFERQGRFYLVDWKSNQLSRCPEDFDAPGLAAEMRRHSYYLQYLIYTAALHGFLAGRLDAYEYDRHFGGVFYLFLRGIGAREQAPGRGVFHDRPSQELIEPLSGFLAGGAS